MRPFFIQTLLLLAVSFGIATPEQARQVAQLATSLSRRSQHLRNFQYLSIFIFFAALFSLVFYDEISQGVFSMWIGVVIFIFKDS